MSYIDTIKLRLIRKSHVDEFTGCRLWTGSKDKDGYGTTYYYGKTIGVHRLSAILHLGLAHDDNHMVLHKRECPNRHCFEPNHLYLGSQIDNMQDRIAVGNNHNVAKDCCPVCGDAYSSVVRRSGLRKGMIFRRCNSCQNRRRRKQ